jgi:hypothetical protein
MVMSVFFGSLHYFGLFLCPALVDRIHHQSFILSGSSEDATPSESAESTQDEEPRPQPPAPMNVRKPKAMAKVKYNHSYVVQGISITRNYEI